MLQIQSKQHGLLISLARAISGCKLAPLEVTLQPVSILPELQVAMVTVASGNELYNCCILHINSWIPSFNFTLKQ